MSQLRALTEEVGSADGHAAWGRYPSSCAQDIARARGEHDREARLARVAILVPCSVTCPRAFVACRRDSFRCDWCQSWAEEQLVSILRENGDKQLRGFHNAALAL